MNFQTKILFITLMTTALIFGFADHIVPGTDLHFERLHIFLFNLCSGGTIILYFTEKQKKLSPRGFLFLMLAVAYAILAFFEIYIPAMIISVFLALIVESIRIQRFSWFPINFFQKEAPVHERFHQAALLCLSCGLIISALVILNNEYLHIITTMPKLKIDTFFLGFSFPVSLITMSVIYSFMKTETSAFVSFLKKTGFWSINLGVIIFFIFILFEKLMLQFIVSSILFLSVVLIFYLYCTLAKSLQQKLFLTSGAGFLCVTAITGIAYIILEFIPGYDSQHFKGLLWLHTFASLYGWNICGLAIICRFNDFPVRLHSLPVIVLHWVTVLVLAPLGKYYPVFAVITILGYATILNLLLFSKKTDRLPVR